MSFVSSKFMFHIFYLSLIIAQTTLAQHLQTCNVTLTLKEQDKNGFMLKNYFSDENRVDSCWLVVNSLNADYGIRVEYTRMRHGNKFNCTSECCEYLDIGYGTKVDQSPLLKSHCISTETSLSETEIYDSSAIWLNFRSVKNLVTMLKFKPIKLVYKQPSGFISSPENKKKSVMNNLNVTYKIQANENHLIYMRFNSFSLESFNDSCIDYLEVGAIDALNQTSGALSGEKLSNKYCDLPISSQIYIYSSEVFLRLVTDSSEMSDGFSLYYNTIKYFFTEPFGNIISSDYPINITYMIRAPADQKIELVINEFEFSSCNVDDTDNLVEVPNSVCSRANDYIMVVFFFS